MITVEGDTLQCDWWWRFSHGGVEQLHGYYLHKTLGMQHLQPSIVDCNLPILQGAFSALADKHRLPNLIQSGVTNN